MFARAEMIGSTARLAIVGAVLACLSCASAADDAVVGLIVRDAPVQQGLWRTTVDESQMSLEFKPEREDEEEWGGHSSSTWSASLEHSISSADADETGEESLDVSGDRPQHPTSISSAGGEWEAGTSGEDAVDALGYEVSLGRFTLVRQPAVSRDSAVELCSSKGEGVRLASVSTPEDIGQLRDLNDNFPAERGGGPSTAYLDMADVHGRLVGWSIEDAGAPVCLVMDADGELYLRDCEARRAFFCERQPFYR